MRRIQTIEAMKALVGTELGVSDWVLIDQERIDDFARATGDDYWIHVDVERAARELPQGRTLAHGYLTLSLVTHLSHQIWTLESLERGLNYGLEKVRMPSPVRAGDRVRLRQSLVSIEDLGPGNKTRFHNVMEIEGGSKPACISDSISAIYERRLQDANHRAN
ncbi:Acyl dehydratase [Lutimaribacter pacificus]|uniref:Acyl dehydratase n=1 Tax=Lutimaribacter pacificus TaxID=391948 RepID=A0A1H0HLW2_9RHOB|nr:MaoC family dehydratase [Lutimaribacter pacificus]SDO20199.1 Acyl dehydratase [Lutimaribacter pacificus]SHK34147.1 Acyl dehydratase [Lutimaribacter pacificus]